jgi:hypothetical protein
METLACGRILAGRVMGLSFVAMSTDEDFRPRLAAVERIDRTVLALFLDRLIASSKRRVSRLLNDNFQITVPDSCGPKEMTL